MPCLTPRLINMISFFASALLPLQLIVTLLLTAAACFTSSPAGLAYTHHPAVLRLIEMTVQNAHKAGIWAGICGELAADTLLTETFVNMGVDELSVSASSVLKVRKAVRDINA